MNNHASFYSPEPQASAKDELLICLQADPVSGALGVRGLVV